MPLHWNELTRLTSGAHWHVGNLDERLAVGNSPWAGYAGAAVSATAALRMLAKARA